MKNDYVAMLKQRFIRIDSNYKALLVSVVTFILFFYKLFLPDYLVYGSDAEQLHLPVRQYLFNQVYIHKEFPFWSEKIYSGFPLYKYPEYQYLNPINVAGILILGPINSYKVIFIASYLVGSYSLWLFIKSKGSNLLGYYCTNLIYYFSFFLMNHLIHYNMVIAVCLLPLVLLFFDQLLALPSKFNIVTFSLILSYIFYCGHYQTTLLTIIALLFYLLIMVEDTSRFKIVIRPLFTSVIIIFFLTLPLNLSTYSLAKDSIRNINPEFSISEGTYYFPMFFNTVIPYLYKYNWNFTARDLIDRTYTYTETYTYIGISSVLFGVLGYFLSKKQRLTYFSCSQIIIFILLASLGQFNFSKNIPILNLFRHWERSVFLANLGIGFLISHYTSNYHTGYSKITFTKGSLLLVGIPILYLLFLSTFYSGNVLYQRAIKFSSFNLDVHGVWLVVILLVISSFALLYSKKTRVVACLLACLTLFIDLRYYGSDVIKTRIYEVEIPVPVINIDGFDNKRIIDFKNSISGMQYLNTNYYTLFGNSQFINQAYKQALLKYKYRSNITNPNKWVIVDNDLSNYFGVEAIITYDGNIIHTNPAKEYSYLVDNEQYKKIETTTDAKDIFVSVRCDDDWVVKVNGNITTPKCDSKGLYTIINSNGKKGNIIEYKYTPIRLYISYTIALCGSALAIYLINRRCPVSTKNKSSN